jgi:hypothetical protein
MGVLRSQSGEAPNQHGLRVADKDAKAKALKFVNHFGGHLRRSRSSDSLPPARGLGRPLPDDFLRSVNPFITL